MSEQAYPGHNSIHRTELSNGIVVLVYENFAAASVAVEGYLHAGALNESRAQAGLADFVAGMLMRGTEKRTLAEIYETVESVGASLDFSASRHTTEFSAGGLAEDLDLLLTLIAESLRTPTFPEEEVEQLRGEIVTSLQIRRADTRQMAGLRFRERAYDGHPYGRSLYGYLDTIPAITRDDLAAFHSRHYGPAGATLVIVGAVKAERVVAQVEAVLGSWRNDSYRPVPTVPAAPLPVVTVREDIAIPEKTQSDVVLGLPGPARAAPDYLDLSMANTILGVFGMMGRLGANVREKQGLAYYAYSRLQGGLGPGPWYVSTGVAPDMVEQAIASILDEIERMQDEPVSAEELADSQAYRTGSLPVGLETNDGLASILSDIELLDLGLDYLQRYDEMINDITVERVQAAAQKYWSTQQLMIAVAGPPADDPPPQEP